jgi:hypothetical protein
MRPLAKGLSVCAGCGEVRGTNRRGWRSRCYCEGVECSWCGTRLREPITDYYDRHDRGWWHVPHFALGAHSCPPGTTGSSPRRFIRLAPDDVAPQPSAEAPATVEVATAPAAPPAEDPSPRRPWSFLSNLVPHSWHGLRRN